MDESDLRINDLVDDVFTIIMPYLDSRARFASFGAACTRFHRFAYALPLTALVIHDSPLRHCHRIFVKTFKELDASYGAFSLQTDDLTERALVETIAKVHSPPSPSLIGRH